MLLQISQLAIFETFTSHIVVRFCLTNDSFEELLIKLSLSWIAFQQLLDISLKVTQFGRFVQSWHVDFTFRFLRNCSSFMIAEEEGLFFGKKYF